MLVSKVVNINDDQTLLSVRKENERQIEKEQQQHGEKWRTRAKKARSIKYKFRDNFSFEMGPPIRLPEPYAYIYNILYK